MNLSSSLVIVLSGAALGGWMAYQQGQRVRALAQIGRELEQVCLGAAYFKRPLGELIREADGLLSQIYLRDDCSAVYDADRMQVKELLQTLGHMSAHNCDEICRGVREKWAAYSAQMVQEAEKNAKLWRVLPLCGAAMLAILLL